MKQLSEKDIQTIRERQVSFEQTGEAPGRVMDHSELTQMREALALELNGDTLAGRKAQG